MKYLKLIIICIFFTCNAIGQDIDLKYVRKSFTAKYYNSNNTRITYLNSYYIKGNNPIKDTITVILSNKKKIKLKNQIQLKINSFNLLYDGDSIYRKYDNGKIIDNTEFTKGYNTYLKQYLNPNPFYNSMLFFWYLPKCEVNNIQEIDNKTIIDITYTEKKYYGKRIANYVLNITDTVIEKYYVDYISDNIDFTTKYEYYDYISFTTDSVSKTNFFKNTEKITAKNYEPNKRNVLEKDNFFKNYKCLNLNGDTVSLKSFNAKFYLIDLWYIGCKPCAKALPYINDIHKDFPELKVIGLNVLNKKLQDVKDYKEKKKINYTILVNDNIRKEINTEGYPYFIILDSNLKILYFQKGFTEKKIKEIRKHINTLVFKY